MKHWNPWRKWADEKRMRIDFEIPSETVIRTDENLFSSILANLFSNAVEYCPHGGSFSCKGEKTVNEFMLTLTNTNNSLTREDLPFIFEQLWRKDPARTGNSHIGLGLTLVQVFAESLGIQLHTDLGEQELEFFISLKIPLGVTN
jgi:signal transduction histidine kinase